MYKSKRHFFATVAAVAVASALLSPLAQAGDYPDRPITLLVGYAAGGQTDLVARAAAMAMAKDLGQPIKVVNKPGAGGAVAAQTLLQSSADGYTVLLHPNVTVNLAPLLMERIPFKVDQFAYAGMLTAYQLGLVAHKEAPYNNLAQFVSWAKSNPGFSYGSLGPSANLYIDALVKAHDLRANIVPLKGGGDMVNSVLGKQVALAWSGGIHKKYPEQMKMLAAVTTFRHPSDPQVETIDEAGYPLGMDTRLTLMLPVDAPRPLLDRLAQALKAAAEDADFKKIVATAHIPIMFKGVDAARQEMQQSYARNKAILEGAGIQPK
jgi:tripartite-type tricarboxylate transporter receptor subunit TctC